MGVVAAGLMVAGAASEASGAYYEGKAAQAAANYNAKVAKIQARLAAEKVRSDAAMIRSENIVRVAKSGVRMEGSPLSVLARNAFNSEKQALSALRAGRAQYDLLKMQGKDAKAAGISNMNTSLIRGAANAASLDSGGLLNRGSGGSSGGWTAQHDNASRSLGLYQPNFNWVPAPGS